VSCQDGDGLLPPPRAPAKGGQTEGGGVADGFTIKLREELESMEGSGNANWLLIRRPLELDAFGINMVEIGPGGQIPEHDETASGEVEVYAILEGKGKFRLDGEDHEAPAGTFVRMDPEVSRTIVNDSNAPVTALLIGVPADSGYEAAADWL
jgi:quercetin dioxygenase-like cupin family protein